MKFKTLLILALMLAATATTYQIYDSNQVVISKYTVNQRSDGTLAVYPTGKPVLPKYIIKGDKVYPSGKPVLPIYDIKDWRW